MTIVSNQWHGICFWNHSSNNYLANNTISNNAQSGMQLEDSSNDNIVCLNNFAANGKNVASYNSKNTWSFPSPITYIYNETTYKNYLGNYWDDYTGLDDNKDGIGDTSYSINKDKDDYPLIKRFENYAIEEEIKRPEIPTEEETSPEVPTGEEKGIPGFEVVFAIAGLVAVAYVLRRKRK